MLECYEAKQKPLMLYSSPKSPFAHEHSDYVFKANGEMKQSVRLALEKFADGRIMDDATPSKFFHWRLFHTDPEMRYETMGENIPVRWHYIIHNGFATECDSGEWEKLAVAKAPSSQFPERAKECHHGELLSFIPNHLVFGLY